MRRGFTLLETMLAAATGAIALAAVLSSFMAAQKMLHTAMAESELSLAMREMREKLLFKASPDVSGSHYGGLLSGSGLNENEAKSYSSVEMGGHAVGSSLGSTSDSSVRLLVWTSGGSKMLINERTPDKDAHVRWLWPGGMSLVKRAPTPAGDEDDVSMSDVLGCLARNGNGSNIYRIYLDIDQKIQLRDNARVVRRERVCVPILGKLQPMRDEN
ncbi:MAG: hypothetical protein J6T51_07005 [Kiritimatiellae bacterium]|nr:hypothetical protein [Kiritimatiellia bacterium]